MSSTTLFRKIWLKLCRNYGAHIPLAALASPPQDKKWVFLVGSYNSGTTLLNELLGMHPHISALPYEGVSLASKLTRPEDYGWPRMWHRCIDELMLPIEMEADIADRTKREWGLCFDKSKPVLLEKSIVNAARIPWLIKFFQPAYFIHIVRNGYAVSEGIRRRTESVAPAGYPYSLELCATQWSITNKVIRRDLSDYHNQAFVTYEALTENTVSVLHDIVHFLDLDSSLLPDVGKLRVHGETSIVDNRNQGSLNKLSMEDVAEINRAAEDELKFYGYLEC